MGQHCAKWLLVMHGAGKLGRIVVLAATGNGQVKCTLLSCGKYPHYPISANRITKASEACIMIHGIEWKQLILA